MQQESTTPASQIRTVEDEPTFGCSMLTRIRQLPWGLEDRPTSRCSLGFALHTDDEVAQCRGVEGPAACWKASANWRVAPAPGPGPRGERPDIAATNGLPAPFTATGMPPSAPPTPAAASLAPTADSDAPADASTAAEQNAEQAPTRSRRGDRRQRAAARAAARAQERADAEAAARAASEQNDSTSQVEAGATAAEAALAGELQVLPEAGAEPQPVAVSHTDTDAASPPAEAVLADADASAAGAQDDAATDRSNLEVTSTEQVLSPAVADLPELRESAAPTALEVSDADVANTPAAVVDPAPEVPATAQAAGADAEPMTAEVSAPAEAATSAAASMDQPPDESSSPSAAPADEDLSGDITAQDAASSEPEHESASAAVAAVSCDAVGADAPDNAESQGAAAVDDATRGEADENDDTVGRPERDLP